MVLRGAGTQRIEEELLAHFPEMRLGRLDSDSVRRPGAHEDILGRFLEGELDVLLGTQMVAKGLDFPRVTLVGVINADTGLHLPDYRSTERTFQLLTQVAGRAGRSALGGEVLIQTRCPDHSCLLAAKDHDDAAFRATVIPERKDLRYPPFAKLASVLVRGPSLPPRSPRSGASTGSTSSLRAIAARTCAPPPPARWSRFRRRARWRSRWTWIRSTCCRTAGDARKTPQRGSNRAIPAGPEPRPGRRVEGT
jgi:primosomal protein N' (replication factor Y)